MRRINCPIIHSLGCNTDNEIYGLIKYLEVEYETVMNIKNSDKKIYFINI